VRYHHNSSFLDPSVSSPFRRLRQGVSCLLFGSSPRLSATRCCKVYKRYTISICPNDIRDAVRVLPANDIRCTSVFLCTSRVSGLFCLTLPFLSSAPLRISTTCIRLSNLRAREWGVKKWLVPGWKYAGGIRILAVPVCVKVGAYFSTVPRK
jgi:hypothetical protein